MNIYDLTCIYDKRKSFYSKAKVWERGTKLTLISYNTKVAVIDKSKKVLTIKKTNFANSDGKYSQTTTRHIREFARQNGFGYLDVVRVGKINRY